MVRRAPSFEPLTPTAFLSRAAVVCPDRPALVDGDTRLTYAELEHRVLSVAGALAARGRGPMVGAVLAPLNHRLAVAELTSCHPNGEPY
jgi:fatty-acyl-CoA synthase